MGNQGAGRPGNQGGINPPVEIPTTIGQAPFNNDYPDAEMSGDTYDEISKDRRDENKED